MAVDRAMLLARKELAQQLGARVSADIGDFATDSDKSSDDFQAQIKAVGRSVALDVSLAGYVRENDEVVAEGGKYRAFVMLRYPIGEINKVIASQVKKNAVLEKKLEASEAWKQLEKEIEAAKKK
jgi:3-oxoacyl-(acyl-carrier-protein) synthase